MQVIRLISIFLIVIRTWVRRLWRIVAGWRGLSTEMSKESVSINANANVGFITGDNDQSQNWKWLRVHHHHCLIGRISVIELVIWQRVNGVTMKIRTRNNKIVIWLTCTLRVSVFSSPQSVISKTFYLNYFRREKLHRWLNLSLNEYHYKYFIMNLKSLKGLIQSSLYSVAVK